MFAIWLFLQITSKKTTQSRLKTLVFYTNSHLSLNLYINISVRDIERCDRQTNTQINLKYFNPATLKGFLSRLCHFDNFYSINLSLSRMMPTRRYKIECWVYCHEHTKTDLRLKHYNDYLISTNKQVSIHNIEKVIKNWILKSCICKPR